MRAVTVFYVWQSDVKRTRNALSGSLEWAAEDLRTADLYVAVDSDTRGEAGAVPIDHVIFKKIQDADVVVCDITPIGKADTGAKVIPNPNVMVELGYALGTIGHNRVILVRDSREKGDLPFDIQQLRHITFETPAELRPQLRHALDACLRVHALPGDAEARARVLRGIPPARSTSADGQRARRRLEVEIDYLSSSPGDTYARLAGTVRHITSTSDIKALDVLATALKHSSGPEARHAAEQQLKNFLDRKDALEESTELGKRLRKTNGKPNLLTRDTAERVLEACDPRIIEPEKLRALVDIEPIDEAKLGTVFDEMIKAIKDAGQFDPPPIV